MENSNRTANSPLGDVLLFWDRHPELEYSALTVLRDVMTWKTDDQHIKAWHIYNQYVLPWLLENMADAKAIAKLQSGNLLRLSAI